MGKEFLFTEEDFKSIREQVYAACGIVLGEHKKEMVYSRLTRRLRALGLANFAAYLAYLDANKDAEFTEFINAITTNLTSFFRESHHFDFLQHQLMPKILAANQQTKRIRIWSAGCSTGEEAYSIAMTLRECAPKAGWDVKILATDLDSNVLTKAKNGTYTASSVTGLTDTYKKKYMQKSRDGNVYKVKPDVAKLVHFKQLNLLAHWPMKGPFDLIFCRNVVIYFDVTTKNQLFNRFADYLAPHGALFLGHSESLSKGHSQFISYGKTMYGKEPI